MRAKRGTRVIDNKVKLVIWDLDETFWKGTLSEEGITPVQRNADIVRELSHRGIVNSICSKNDFETAKAKLVELDIWDHFIFPQITFAPKGKAIAEMIEGAGLRAENVLFIDDNNLNLEEVKFFNAGIMALHPDQVLNDLLDHPHCKGKPDPELTRLKQYKVLEKKAEERTTTKLSNEEFLRSCNIRISIDYDIEANFDRAVELINRANQLNYTKRRIEKERNIDRFREMLGTFGFQAGCIRAVDNYGDYGIVGVFMVRRRNRGARLLHFVFSCRTMHMGIEQYVYELLGKPEIDIVEPVSYGLQSHKKVDWITLVNDEGLASPQGGGPNLVLIGGCDLLQLASYCSSNRTEFVNAAQDDEMVRYDDPGFLCSAREAIRACEAIRHVPCWTYEDAIRFDDAAAKAEVVIVSMWNALRGRYLKAGDVELRLRDSHVVRLEDEKPEWFAANFEPITLGLTGRLARIDAAYDALARKTPANCHIFVLGTYSRGDIGDQMLKTRETFNAACRAYCERHPGKFHFIDIDPLVDPESMVDHTHFSPAGYLTIAKHIVNELAAPETLVAAQ